MQVSEEKAVSITAVDGGLADLYVEMSGFPVSDADGDRDRLATAIERIIHAAAVPPIRVRHEAAAPGHTDAGMPKLRAPQRFATRMPDITVSRIRSFEPFIKSGLRSLDVAIVTAGPLNDPASAAAPLRTGTWNAPAGDRAECLEGLLDAACRYAVRFARQRVCLVAGQADVADVRRIDGGTLDRLSQRYPSLELKVTPARKALRSLLSGRTDLDVVAADCLSGELLIETAMQLGGAAELATETRFAGGMISVSPAASGREVTTAEDELDACDRPAALLLAAVDLMMWLDQDVAAGRIMHSFCRNLERGCHTPELWLVSPCSRMLDTEEFEEVIISSLGERSEKLEPRGCGALPGAFTRRSRASLRLVHSA